MTQLSLVSHSSSDGVSDCHLVLVSEVADVVVIGAGGDITAKVVGSGVDVPERMVLGCLIVPFKYPDAPLMWAAMSMFLLQVIQFVPSNFSLSGNKGGDAPLVEDIVFA